MSRPPRIQYPGAIYHIISRGNYRKDLFCVGESGKSFEKALFECCIRSRWKLHAYVIMSNHYHLCLETPEGNLVDGMKWLQGTFGNRFNRFTGEKGHVFQGRYKALLLERGEWLVSLVNYIHLNPVRAKLLSISDLKQYNLSSFPKFFRRNVPEFLIRSDFLAQAGFSTGVSGMKAYGRFLEIYEEANTDDSKELEKQFSSGWILADKKRKKEIAKDFVESGILPNAENRKLKEMHQASWDQLVCEELLNVGKTEEDVSRDRKLANWKINVAKVLKSKTMASNPWIAKRLNMGDPSNVSRYAK